LAVSYVFIFIQQHIDSKSKAETNLTEEKEKKDRQTTSNYHAVSHFPNRRYLGQP